MPLAKSVGAEPVSHCLRTTGRSSELWEIHAGHIEDTLLGQVRVAKISQEIKICVLGRTIVSLRVVSLDPQSKSDALLLTTNTESLSQVSVTNESEPASKVISGVDRGSAPSSRGTTRRPLQHSRGVKHWWGNAAWHRSGMVAFDKVDKLLGVELERAYSFRVRYPMELFVAPYSTALNSRGIMVVGRA
ncbi:hypothetical protein FIBSPDRAFT_959997 [Athelia psychrophila]|uniref:Peroxisomal ATPase PEX1 N-terminal C-lobe domain-containing protein n=1 Tax=Athelia psychrophila TaxID=1759441 RepID=A0A166CVT5_9AGAM|nr:hypothetical protein FIBSPDRAFT_959997 [Fibularhizoctonia sp. CBS 109695]